MPDDWLGWAAGTEGQQLSMDRSGWDASEDGRFLGLMTPAGPVAIRHLFCHDPRRLVGLCSGLQRGCGQRIVVVRTCRWSNIRSGYLLECSSLVGWQPMWGFVPFIR
jgi:hypothetical protein